MKTKETIASGNSGLDNEEIFKKLLNNTVNIHLVYLDREFNFLYVNNAYAKTCGYKPEEMIGKNHFALILTRKMKPSSKKYEIPVFPLNFVTSPSFFPTNQKEG